MPFVDQGLQGMSQWTFLALLCPGVEVPRCHLAQRMTYHANLAVGTGLEVEVAPTVHRHRNDREAQIILMLTKQAKTPGRGSGERQLHAFFWSLRRPLMVIPANAP